MDEGEDRRFGKEPGEGEKDLLAPAHAGEPVVDEGDPRGERSVAVSGRARSPPPVTGWPSTFMYPAWMASTERSQLKSFTRARPVRPQLGAEGIVVEDALEAAGDVLDAVRIDEDRGVAHHLGQRRDAST